MSRLIAEIQRRYNFTVYGYEASALGYVMETNKGKVFLYCLPPSCLPKEPFVRDIHARMADTRMLLPIIPTVEGEEILRINDDYFYLTGWPNQDTDIVDYALLGESLASFHLASSKRVGYLKGKFNNWGSWPRTWRSRVGRLDRYRRNSLRRKERKEATEFDAFFVENFDHICFLGTRSISYLEEYNYAHVVKQSMPLGTLSYTQFGFDQFVMTPQRNLFFLDSFSWVEDMRARDIAYFIKEDVREYGWNPYHIHAFLMAYHAKSPLLKEEFGVMYASFLLPGRMLQKLESINYRPKIWAAMGDDISVYSDDTDSLTAALAYEELKRNDVLLREFPGYVANTFGCAFPSVYKRKKSP